MTRHLPFETTPWETDKQSNSLALAIGDVDGDGTLDLVFGNAGRNTLYLRSERNPAWFSDSTNTTRSLALGDIDGDGDLDLVCGNDGQPNTLYRNIDSAGVFETWPTWLSRESDNTTSVVLADVDGDGDLDLVCGNDGQSNRLYLNTAGATIFDSSAVWSSPNPRSTQTIALGDVDGDSLLDLVCGNRLFFNELYLNFGGPEIFETGGPSWASEGANNTSSVALGDVDGDGDLDLVCGNVNQGITLYVNQNGVLDTTATRVSASSGATRSLDLGDIDGDGDLDLVCGNDGQQNTLFRNLGTSLDSLPAWLSDPARRTMQVALGDMNGDGDLDLVCANTSFSANTMYTNLLEVFETVPFWESGGVFRQSHDVAIGDLDGNGDPDLVFANEGDVNTVYENDRGTLTRNPYTLAPRNATQDVELGDVDGDGDLDLVCANLGQSNTLYLNAGGQLARFPTWQSIPALRTGAVALGDIDLDGDLDLVCGNGVSNPILGLSAMSFEVSTLYLNRGDSLETVFDTHPAWTSNEAPTRSVALGDIDGDGDLDLVCGNVGEPNTMYLNDKGALESSPSWFSSLAEETWSIALGDVNADGRLDLVCGNLGKNTLYLNDGSTFETEPTWFSDPANPTWKVVLGDVDADGDLDLVCANEDANAAPGALFPITLYLNNGGKFTTEPQWASEDLRRTRGIALADIDGDGDLDLVGANRSAFNMMYRGLRGPSYRWDSTQPTHQRPNNMAHLRHVRTEQSGDSISVHIEAVDVESDPVHLLTEYQYVGDPQRFPIDLQHASALLGTSAAGMEHTLVWDTNVLPLDPREVVLHLRTSEIPGRVSSIQGASGYSVMVGAILPYRGEITTSTSHIVFPVVTAGDTVSAELLIRNSGNTSLEINRIDLIKGIDRPIAEMRHDLVLPHVLAPGSSVGVKFLHEPLDELETSGEIVIHSDDPITPAAIITTEMNPRALRFLSQLLARSPVPLGEALTILVVPATDVRIEFGMLHICPGNQQTAIQLPLQARRDVFVANIPGYVVGESGFEYFIEVHNDPVVAVDPPGAPDSLFRVSVQSPSQIISSLVSTSEPEFAENTRIQIRVQAQPGTNFQSVRAHYRRGGETGYATIDLSMSSPALALGEIPDSVVTLRGLEYWVEANTETALLYDPPTGGNAPHSLQVQVLNLREEQRHPAATYRMVSIPMDVEDKYTLENLLSDLPAFGPYDSTQWRSYRWAPKLRRYVELDAGSGQPEIHEIHPGRAYWLISRDENQLASRIPGLSTPTDSFSISLEPGWNQIGNPFAFPVAWASVDLSDAAAGQIEPPLRWLPSTGSDGRYEEVELLMPFEGCFIMNVDSLSSHRISIPPIEASALARTTLSSHDGAVSDSSWDLVMTISACGLEDQATAGLQKHATSGWDAFDRSDPPGAPGRQLSVYFPHTEWRTFSKAFAVDRREPHLEESAASGHLWRFDVTKNFCDLDGGDPVELRFAGIETIPEEFQAFLLDHELDRAIDLREADAYTFFLGTRGPISEEEARFTLVVGGELFAATHREHLDRLPLETRLHKNRPNPFRRGTLIRFDLAVDTQPQIEIFDVRGRRVRVLSRNHSKPGRYEMIWDGLDQDGFRVPAGIYFYRLKQPMQGKTHKMLLLR